MTEEEFYDLYNKISDTIDGFKDYHYYYIIIGYKLNMLFKN